MIANVKLTKRVNRDPSQTNWDVARNGLYFGQIWTSRTPDGRHPFHAKIMCGTYDTFPTLAEAKRYMELAAA